MEIRIECWKLFSNMSTRKFYNYKQLGCMDCGPSCLRMICAYHNQKIKVGVIQDLCCTSTEGVSIYGLSKAALELNMTPMCIQTSVKDLIKIFSEPCILHWNGNHFVVLYDIRHTRKGFIFYVANPMFGKIVKLTMSEFTEAWARVIPNHEGTALLISPNEDFVAANESNREVERPLIRRMFSSLIPYKRNFLVVVLLMLLTMVIQMIMPFASKSMVDKGIIAKDLDFIYLILLGQISLELGNAVFCFIRSWILTRVGLLFTYDSLSKYFKKLMDLPISFFDKKFGGDIIQRINDHYRIQYFLTNNSIDIIFSIICLIVFGSVLLYFNKLIALVFLAGSIIYVVWVIMFMNRRGIIDQKMFSLNSANQNSMMQLLYGMQEIKLNNCEQLKLEEWQKLQLDIREQTLQGLKISQYQQTGGILITNLKNLTITGLVAMLVSSGDMTFGMMISIQYIIGMLGSPLEQMINAIRQYQDAQLSIERMSDVYDGKSEDHIADGEVIKDNADIVLKNVSFRYDKISDDHIIHDFSLTIPHGKTTAIVGLSGSGKTTLLKLLLGFYKPEKGSIMIGGKDLSSLNKREWRKVCGIVMQDGYLFSDTIEKNIAMSDDIDEERLSFCAKISNALDFILKMPLGFKTKVGNDGKGISLGQKQRLLIARALYKNPQFVFFDEATNSLDTKNESEISRNLYKAFRGKTVIIIAHRLSTIKAADQIIVMDKGKLIEFGSHEELLKEKNHYWNLIQNQSY